MAINPNIDGVNKTVISPEVNIDGVWKEVSTVSNNIDGVWKVSYTRAYTVNLYRYGTLWKTITVTPGNSISLSSYKPSPNTSDDFYGWSTNSTASSVNYSSSATITPTEDMDLYAVFRTVTYTIRLYNGNSLYDSASVTKGEYFYLSSYTPSKSGYTLKGWSTSSAASSVQYNINEAFKPTESMSLYAVFESNTICVRYYRYGSLWDSIIVTRGTSVTLVACSVAYADDEFYGWSLNSTSTTKNYSAGDSITPTDDVSLHAVFRYGKSFSYTTLQASSGQYTPTDSKSVTAPCSGTMYVTAKWHKNQGTAGPSGSNVNQSNGYITLTSGGNTYCKVNSTYVTGLAEDLQYSVSAGDTITIVAGDGYDNGTTGGTSTINNGGTTVAIRYPASVSSWGYRVSSHS